MSSKDIRDLYEGMLKGEECMKSKRVGDLYGDVLREAKVSFSFNDGSSDDIDISDERAAELRQIANVSTVRNQAIYKIDGQWVGYRLTKKQVRDLYNTTKGMSDFGVIQERIIKISKNSSIFEAYAKVRGFDSIIEDIQQFLWSSAEKTLTSKNKPISSKSIKREMSVILTNIETGQYQKSLIDYLDASSSDGGWDSGAKNLFVIMDPGSKSTIDTVFDIKNHPDMVNLRPAGDNNATRGAAGPGEALLSFIYRGIKPKGVGDILLDSGDGDTIELKKVTGRIGKDIAWNKALEGEFNSLFHPKTKIKVPAQNHFRSKWNELVRLASRRDPKSLDLMVRDDDEMKELIGKLPDEIYVSLGINRPVAEPGIQIFPVSIIGVMNDIITGTSSTSEDSGAGGLLDIWLNNSINLEGLLNTKNKLKTRNIDLARHFAGSFKEDAIPRIQSMTAVEFFDKYSGVTTGKKVDSDTMDLFANLDMPDGKKSREVIGRLNVSLPEGPGAAWSMIENAPGVNTMDKIANLIGGWHLKYYLTHIEPFKWLLVFDMDGRSAGCTFNTIINTPLSDLLVKMDKIGIKFGVRRDKQGFDIQLK